MGKHILSSKVSYDCGCSCHATQGYRHPHLDTTKMQLEIDRLTRRDEEHQQLNGALRTELTQTYSNLGKVEIELHQLKELHNDNRRSVPSV